MAVFDKISFLLYTLVKTAKNVKIACLLICLCVPVPALLSQEAAQTVPDALRRPERGEAPRYPRDLVIGELGQGEASEGAYLFVRSFLSDLMAGRVQPMVGSVSTENLREEITGIRARSYRLGGGRNEPDGCVSFLVRFLGPNESITGELFIRIEGGIWVLDDLVLEEKKTFSEIRENFRFDFSPYERFF